MRITSLITYLDGSMLTNDIVYFFAVLVSLFIIFWTFITIGRHLSKIATFSLFIFVASLLSIVYQNRWAEMITWLNIGEALQNIIHVITLPFYYLYTGFSVTIISLFNLMNNASVTEVVTNVLSNYIFIAVFHGVLCLFNMLVFRKRKKKAVKPSEYDY